MVTKGTTKVTCRLCGTSAVLKNEDMEVMREHRCTNPECNARMNDHQFTNMKAAYFLGMAAKFAEHFGKAYQDFSFEIDISLKYTPDWAVSAENGSRQGG